MSAVICKWCKTALSSNQGDPCPNCGKENVRDSLTVSQGRLSKYALDTFVAPKISELTVCSIPDMSNHSSESEHWVSNFILNSIFRVSVEPRPKQYILFFLRRAETAFREYENARISFQDYVDGRRQRVSVYFKSLFHFETCIAQMWQAIDQTMSFGKRATGETTKIYTKGDGSSYERLNNLYNISRYAGDNIPESGTLPVWLTNVGLEAKDISTSFVELAEILGEIGNMADTFSNPPVSSSSQPGTN
jgi:hypothetical protein